MKELLEELKPVQNLSLHQCKTFHKILLWYKTLLDIDILGHGSRLKQLPAGLSFNGNGREGVQHVDVEKRERRKRGVKEESSRRRRHFRESEPLWRGRTCCEIFFYRRLTIKKQRMCLAAAYTVPENAFRITNPAILISFLEK